MNHDDQKAIAVFAEQAFWNARRKRVEANIAELKKQMADLDARIGNYKTALNQRDLHIQQLHDQIERLQAMLDDEELPPRTHH